MPISTSFRLHCRAAQAGSRQAVLELDKDRMIHERGRVSVLRQIHDDLDAAVADAYGWPADLSDEEILRRLVALNAERTEEEKRGLIRWLRPEFQNPTGASASQGTLAPATAAAWQRKPKNSRGPSRWPSKPNRFAPPWPPNPGPATASELAKHFKGAKADRVAELLATLAALGQARNVAGERFVA
jgi:hypothetical protein